MLELPGYDASATSREVTNADTPKLQEAGPKDQHLDLVLSLGDALPFVRTAYSTVEQLVVVDDAPMVSATAAETLEGVPTVASEVPRCFSALMTPASRSLCSLLTRQASNDSRCDATPCRGQPQFLPAPGPGPLSTLLETPTPPTFSVVSQNYSGKDIRRLPLSHSSLLP